MASTAIVDSAVLIGAMHARDAHHAAAFRILDAADRGEIAPLVLTDFILAETINYLTRKGGSAVGREALDRIETSQGLRIERTPEAVFSTAKNDVFPKIDRLSLVDSLTVAHLRERGWDRIYSFDDDFDRVPGLKRLVAPGQ